ncbi:MAG: ATP-binding protein [Verrucomicrobia bacterium]|nr:ATP-binding protein [Verrucomicrobiota bacterium]
MPAVAILGPRQCGKSTLARMLIDTLPTPALYLDLERPADLARLEDPEALLTENSNRLVCIDEIQRRPELFPVLRYLIDRNGRNGQFLILGSASRELIRQSSETLAGRIRYMELTPFLEYEQHGASWQDLWVRGGFPRSLLAADAHLSFEWRLDFIRDFLERDIPALSPRTSTQTIRRLWSMLAHVHGQILNMSALANSLDVSTHTVRHHIDLLEGAFMARRLQPFSKNMGKRLTKSPKLYLRDTGILHALLGIESWDGLLGHPVLGFSWEAFCIEHILSRCRSHVQATYYRTARGAEVDLVLENGNSRVAVEFKSSTSPSPRRGFWSATDDLECARNWIVAPVDDAYPMRAARVASLHGFLEAPENGDILR